MSTNISKFKDYSGTHPISEGQHHAVCNGVVDLGVQLATYFGKVRNEHQILISFEFPNELYEYQDELRIRSLSKIFAASITVNSYLRQALKALRRRDLTQEDLIAFNLKDLIGLHCMITITHNVNKLKGKTYANITEINEIAESISTPPPEMPFHFDSEDESTWGSFVTLPLWIQNKINQNQNFILFGVMVDKDGKKIARLDNIQDMEEDVEDDLPF